jgi:hypothetical protein
VSKKKQVHDAGLTLVGFIWRLLFAIVLVLVTYNPSGYSYYHWLYRAVDFGPEHAVSGVVLLGGWLVLVRATLRSLGGLGLIVCTAFMATLVWWLVDLGWLAAGSLTAIAWISLLCLAFLLAIGMSWSHIRRRLTGQYDVDELHD